MLVVATTRIISKEPESSAETLSPRDDEDERLLHNLNIVKTPGLLPCQRSISPALPGQQGAQEAAFRDLQACALRASIARRHVRRASCLDGILCVMGGPPAVNQRLADLSDVTADLRTHVRV